MTRRLLKEYEKWKLSINSTKTQYLCIGYERNQLSECRWNGHYNFNVTSTNFLIWFLVLIYKYNKNQQNKSMRKIRTLRTRVKNTFICKWKIRVVVTFGHQPNYLYNCVGGLGYFSQFFYNNFFRIG